jgi:BirA family biotin operon repressor/biotin-[acetyl-CoA-carboxylase] ligase
MSAEIRDPVIPERVAAHLVPPITGPVVWLPEVGSTNDEAARRAREGAGEGLIVGADHQTAGRGRRGRDWQDEPGSSLAVSVVLRPPLPTDEAGLLPIVAALAVADALDALVDGRPSIVWPNDVVVEGRKTSGILCEMTSGAEGVAWAVVGIGVNVTRAPAMADARWTPACLAELGFDGTRTDALVAVLGALSRRYAQWLTSGADPMVAAYEERDALRGRVISVESGGAELRGQALGVDERGRLRLRVGARVHTLSAGEVQRLSRE